MGLFSQKTGILSNKSISGIPGSQFIPFFSQREIVYHHTHIHIVKSAF